MLKSIALKMHENATIKYYNNTVKPRVLKLGYIGFAWTLNEDGSMSVPFWDAFFEAIAVHGRNIPVHKLDYIIHSHCFKSEEDARNALL